MIRIICPAPDYNMAKEMKVQGIRENLLKMLLKLGESHHPREFLAVLREKGGIVEELDLIPGTINRESSASLSLSMIPLNPHIIGSAHSHPNGVLRPSSADLRLFPRIGRYHLIIGYPYSHDNWRCFNVKGDNCEMEVIP
jgi:proteasome lid subunit RPN8/RPN11